MSIPYIVAATDFSARADRALDRALMLGIERGCGVRVVHALDYIEAEKADWTDLDLRMRECIGETECTTDFTFPEGSPPRAIARAGEADDVDLIVIGPARYNSIGDYFIGTAVDYVLRNTTKPVLVVKQRPRSRYKHIIAGTDFSEGSAHAIVKAAEMFPDAQIHIVHAWHVPFEGFQRDGHVAGQVEEDEQRVFGKFMELLVKDAPHLANATTAMVRGGTHAALAAEFDK
ncbi:MAG: universal stress protein, partial [Pseudomonadota bacterium]